MSETRVALNQARRSAVVAFLHAESVITMVDRAEDELNEQLAAARAEGVLEAGIAAITRDYVVKVDKSVLEHIEGYADSLDVVRVLERIGGRSPAIELDIASDYDGAWGALLEATKSQRAWGDKHLGEERFER